MSAVGMGALPSVAGVTPGGGCAAAEAAADVAAGAAADAAAGAAADAAAGARKGDEEEAGAFRDAGGRAPLLGGPGAAAASAPVDSPAVMAAVRWLSSARAVRALLYPKMMVLASTMGFVLSGVSLALVLVVVFYGPGGEEPEADKEDSEKDDEYKKYQKTRVISTFMWAYVCALTSLALLIYRQKASGDVYASHYGPSVSHFSAYMLLYFMYFMSIFTLMVVAFGCAECSVVLTIFISCCACLILLVNVFAYRTSISGRLFGRPPGPAAGAPARR